MAFIPIPTTVTAPHGLGYEIISLIVILIFVLLTIAWLVLRYREKHQDI